MRSGGSGGAGKDEDEHADEDAAASAMIALAFGCTQVQTQRAIHEKRQSRTHLDERMRVRGALRTQHNDSPFENHQRRRCQIPRHAAYIWDTQTSLCMSNV